MRLLFSKELHFSIIYLLILYSSLTDVPISKTVMTQKIFTHNNQTPNTSRYAKLQRLQLRTKPDKWQA
jgi:hypothetical protein